MKIGIDVQSTTGIFSGLGYYTKNLIQNISRIDTKNEYILLSHDNFAGKLSTPKRIVWEQAVLGIKAYMNKLDLLHVPCFTPPLIRKCKLIVTIHDLIGVRMPENSLAFPSRFYWGRYFPNLSKRADIIITDSEYSRKDIIELLKIPENRIKVIPLAAGERFKPGKDKDMVQQTKNKYNIGNSPYVLFVGNIEYRKNIILLLKIWKKLRLPHKLVLAGSKTGYTDNLVRFISENEIKDRVLLTDYISDEDIVNLYNGADLFVYPSLYEGFGLPVLEAMSCGTPVIASNTTSLPEIVSDAGILTDPNNIDELQDAIVKVLSDSSLRSKLKEKGLIRSKLFSWERVARETLEVYNGIF
ncbi:MAG: glycosyltransferase family 4 protein [Endomicrobiales bacterium]|nr:glycosyltransferase family 4 protein [Endomicrobiales bacterium]